ncbi:histidine kinase [Bradyrhizobium sp.]|uniref:histidine kinase n=1 Tax=Bradyrhizobium sp. TaxID=376 RepID=UPI0025BB422D|nr:histidine kinase [Bradyrhizobium sp.]MBV8922187.1 HAMP domain-containing protein [Bradyrhizobium sp.]
MWRTFSLRTRLNLLLALVLVLGLAINIGRLLLEAGPRVQAEDQSVVKLAREFVQTLVADLSESAEPDARLDQIVTRLGELRHVSITRIRGGAGRAPPLSPHQDTAADAPTVPGWFVTLIHPEQTTVDLPVLVNGRSLGTLAITSHPTDEIAEIWDGIVTQLEVGSAIAIILFVITMTVLNRALAPIQSLAGAMKNIAAGDYETRVTPRGPPEFAAICSQLNDLVATLGQSLRDKQQLAEKIVSLQDAERKDVARELHDEFGPHLFALRAHASALAQAATADAPDIRSLRKHGDSILAQINTLQHVNRRVLDRLRPVGLSELGLTDALGALMRLWREANPGVTIETSISPELGRPGDTAELTIYRIVQEALTNVFRHSGATHVEIAIEPAAPPKGLPAAGAATLLRVRDNGAGLPAAHRSGFGLMGMRERVLALGGTLTVASSEQGVLVEALVPNGAPP